MYILPYKHWTIYFLLYIYYNPNSTYFKNGHDNCQVLFFDSARLITTNHCCNLKMFTFSRNSYKLSFTQFFSRSRNKQVLLMVPIIFLSVNFLQDIIYTHDTVLWFNYDGNLESHIGQKNIFIYMFRNLYLLTLWFMTITLECLQNKHIFFQSCHHDS